MILAVFFLTWVLILLVIGLVLLAAEKIRGVNWNTLFAAIFSRL